MTHDNRAMAMVGSLLSSGFSLRNPERWLFNLGTVVLAYPLAREKMAFF